MVTDRARANGTAGYSAEGRFIAEHADGKGMTLSQVARSIDVPMSTFMGWLRGSKIPLDEGLILADLLGIRNLGRLAPRYGAWKKRRKAS